jgi:hypothetical protein
VNLNIQFIEYDDNNLAHVINGTDYGQPDAFINFDDEFKESEGYSNHRENYTADLFS